MLIMTILDYLMTTTSLSEEKQSQYSGIVAVVLVNLMLIAYGIRVATDPNNFSYEKKIVEQPKPKSNSK